MSNASMWWTAKETEVNNYSIKDWDSASHWNNEEKSLSFHLNFYLNLNDLQIIFIVLIITKQSHYKIVLQKWRSSMSLKKYHDKIIRKHKEWICNIKILFQNISWHFESNEKKILYCMIYLKSESKKLWFNHKETMSAV